MVDKTSDTNVAADILLLFLPEALDVSPSTLGEVVELMLVSGSIIVSLICCSNS